MTSNGYYDRFCDYISYLNNNYEKLFVLAIKHVSLVCYVASHHYIKKMYKSFSHIKLFGIMPIGKKIALITDP